METTEKVLPVQLDMFSDSTPETPGQEKEEVIVREKQEKKVLTYELPAGTELEIHPAANLLPMQTKEDYVRMREGIKSIGQTDPVELLNGKILDGRNRYNACLELGIPIKVINVDIPEEKAEDYVYSRNLQRRQLNKGQLAVMALRFLPEEQKKSKERQLDALKQALVRPKIGQTAKGGVPTVRQKNCLTKNGDVATILGKKVRVNREYIKYAIAVQKKKPELLEKVFSGEMELAKAYSEAKKPAVPVVKHWLKPEQILEVILDRLPEEDNDFLMELAEQTNGKIKQALLTRTKRESIKLLDQKIDEIGGAA